MDLMDWKSAYILVRPETEGVCRIVHTADKLKDARYWLQYIAQAGDAIFLTPKNPQYKGSNGEPCYSAHLFARGKIEHNEADWKKQAFSGNQVAKITFVEGGAEKKTEDGASGAAAKVTVNLADFADGKPRPLSLAQIGALLRDYSDKISVVLAEAGKWIDWESALTLMTQDMYVIGVEEGTDWPLRVTLKPGQDNGQTMNYEEEMKFTLKKKR